MTTLDFVGTAPTIRPGVALVQLHDTLWRVTRPEGDVLGYIEAFRDRQGVRYRAKRLMVRQRRFIIFGEFWGLEEAIDCLVGG